MGPEHFWWGGWWIFPVVMPLVMIAVLVTLLYFVFGGGGFRGPRWHDSDARPSQPKDSETAIEILRKRYARGEINREEFEQIKEDLQD